MNRRVPNKTKRRFDPDQTGAADELCFTQPAYRSLYSGPCSFNEPLPAYPCGLFFGSSRITGKDVLDLHEKEFAIPVTVRHP
ncbi:hypothetical protein, partial [Pseudomonas lundensis]|uniref:hypothetical protein n=1 Tax=Pseudomonas lundensis TaxID=86185 RepID=UPI001C529186